MAAGNYLEKTKDFCDIDGVWKEKYFQFFYYKQEQRINQQRILVCPEY